jgi:hypothetical protein
MLTGGLMLPHLHALRARADNPVSTMKDHESGGWWRRRRYPGIVARGKRPPRNHGSGQDRDLRGREASDHFHVPMCITRYLPNIWGVVGGTWLLFALVYPDNITYVWRRRRLCKSPKSPVL